MGPYEARKGRPEPLGTLGAHIDRASARRLGAQNRRACGGGPTRKADGPDGDASASTCPFWAHPDPLAPLGARKAVKAASSADAGRPGGANTGPGVGGVSTRAPGGLVVSGWRFCVQGDHRSCVKPSGSRGRRVGAARVRAEGNLLRQDYPPAGPTTVLGSTLSFAHDGGAF